MIKRRKPSYSIIRRSRSKGKANSIKQVDVRSTTPKTPRGRLFSDEQSATLSVEKESVEVTLEKKNARKLFSYLMKSLKKPVELNCARQLEEMYYSEEKYLEQLEQLSQAKSIASSLKYYKRCNETSGSNYCKHNKLRRKCDQRSSQTELFIDKKDIETIFIPIKSIHQMHLVLVGALRTELSLTYENAREGKNVIVTQIIRSFALEYLEFSPYFLYYAEYIKNFKRSVETIEILKNQLDGFNDKWARIGQQVGAPVMFLLNQPLMRVTKYPIIFKSLVKRVEKLSEDVDNPRARRHLGRLVETLIKTTKKITTEVDKVNTKIGIGREMQKMRDINVEIGHKLKTTTLLEPSRKFKKEVVVNRFEVGNDIIFNSSCIVFVFNDLVIVAAEESDFASAKRLKSCTFTAKQSVSRLRRESQASSISISSHLLSLSSFKKGGNGETLGRSLRTRSRAGSNAVQRSSGRFTTRPRADSRHSMNLKGRLGKSPSFNGSQGALFNGVKSRKGSTQSVLSKQSYGHKNSFFKTKRRTVENIPGVRNLVPVIEMKMGKLISPDVTEEIIVNKQYFVLHLTYDEFGGDKDIDIKLYFDNMDECQEIKDLYQTLHNEDLSNELRYHEIIRSKSRVQATLAFSKE